MPTQRGVPDVEKLRSRGDVDGLARALRHTGDAGIRAEAARALGRIASPEAVAALAGALRDGRELLEVRVTVAEALGVIRDPRAASVLAETLGNEREFVNVRTAVASVLGRTGAPGAIEPLLGSLRHRNARFREVAARALNQLGWQPGPDETGAAHAVASRDWDRCLDLGEPAAAPLISLLGQTDLDLARIAAALLAQIGSPAVPALVQALSDGQIPHTFVTRILTRIGDPESVEPLLAAGMAPSSPAGLRWEAAEAVRSMGPAAIEPLGQALLAPQRPVREEAARILSAMGWTPGDDAASAAFWAARGDWERCVAIGAPAVRPLLLILEEDRAEQRENAARALGRIGDPLAIDGLAARLADEDYAVTRAAGEALVEIGEAAAGAVIEALRNPRARVQAAWTLSQLAQRLDDPAILSTAAEPLVAALQSADAGTRIWAARALGYVGGETATEALKSALSDRAGAVVKEAAASLNRLGAKP